MKLMWLRHASACDRCVAPLTPNTQAWWDGTANAVVCFECGVPGEPLDLDAGEEPAPAGARHRPSP